MRKFFIDYSNRINKLSILLYLSSFFLLIYFFNIQVIQNEEAKKIVKQKGWKAKTVYGERGEILDRNGNALAISIRKYDFWVNTNLEFDKDKIVKEFSKSFNKPEQHYIDKLNKKSNYVKLEKQALFLDCKNIIENIKDFKGLQIEKNNKRFYPNNNLGCHAVGYTDIFGNGITGIEGSFNAILSGDTTISILKKGMKGNYYEQINKTPTKNNGYNIHLTLDLEYQKILQNEISKIATYTNAKSANGIIINPNNGDILAISSFPTYNPNRYFDYKVEDYKNRTISDAYEPGSTFKTITLAAALETDNINLNDEFFCEKGQMKLENNKLLRDHEEHGDLSAADIFAYSSNIGTSKISEKLSDIELYKYCKNFGFGTKSNLPFNNEAIGKIRDINQWSRTSKNYISIGQELSITNIQLAAAYCSIANGGYLLKPNIIKEIEAYDEILYRKKPHVIRKVITEKTASLLIDAMEKVVDYGTAEKINLDGYKIAGKTGTAQKFIDGSYSSTNFVASFASIFPSDNPEYVIVVSVDSPDYGYHWANESAVPICKEIIKKIIINNNFQNDKSVLLSSNKKIKKENDLSIIKYNKSYKKNNIAPNLKGKSLREALRIANSVGMTIVSEDLIGRVVWQSIKPGEKIDNNQMCKIKLDI